MFERLSPLNYELGLSEAAGDPWTVTRVWASEELNRPYKVVIDAATAVESPDIDSLLGCDAALRFIRGGIETRALCGLVSRVDFLGYQEHHLMVRIHLVPAMAVLRQRTNSQIWQGLSVQALVAKVLEPGLGDYGRSFDLGSVSRGSVAREYCVQYRESDFAFVSRLLEAEGISYEFLHDAEAKTETLSLRDANGQYAELVGVEGSADVPIIAVNPSEADVESIQTFEWSKELTSTDVLRRDYDWQTPTDLLSSDSGAADARGRARRVFAHGERRFIGDDLGERAADLEQGGVFRGQVARGRSNVSAMRPGLRFKVLNHDRPDLEREYLITSVLHTGSEGHISHNAEDGQAYTNQFECVPFDVVLRPRLTTPPPREYGPQTAIVTGPPGEEIHTDEHGRVQVQFYWQEQPSYDADSSCWIRCSQSWAGMNWGAQFIPRVGMEVIVEFLEGNPDRPLVTGCVYNAEYGPPFTLPDNKTQSGWRTNSSPGGEGSNELRFEDAAGEEEIYIHGQKDWLIEIENDKTQTVGHDESLEVGNDRAKKVGHDEAYEIGNDQSGEIGNNQTLSVGSNQSSTIGANRTDQIGANATEVIGAAKTVVVASVFAQTVGASMTTIVGESSTVGIGGAQMITVGESATESVVGDKTIQSQNMRVTAKDKSTYGTGGNMAVVVGEKYGLQAGAKITVKGDDEIFVEAAKKMTFKCGDASITLKKDGKIIIKGSDVKIKGSGNVVIKGQKIDEN